MRNNWSERQDLNLRPPVPQTDALPGCATLRHLGPTARIWEGGRLWGAQYRRERLPDANAFAHPAAEKGGLFRRRNLVLAELGPTFQHFAQVQELVQHVFQALALLGQQGLAGLFGAEIDLLERRHE